MKEIKAIIRTSRLDAVLGALHHHPELPGVTVSVVKGFGRTVGRSHAGAAVQYGTVEMTKLECVVNDEQVDTVITLMRETAHTGDIGDGKIVVYGVDRVIKIRTGEELRKFE